MLRSRVRLKSVPLLAGCILLAACSQTLDDPPGPQSARSSLSRQSPGYGNQLQYHPRQRTTQDQAPLGRRIDPPVASQPEPHQYAAKPSRQRWQMTPAVPRQHPHPVARPVQPRYAEPASPSGHQRTQQPRYDLTGVARWIGPSWRGHVTKQANVSIRWPLPQPIRPFPCHRTPTSRTGPTSAPVLVRINDRTPRRHGKAILVSQRVARLLAFDKVESTFVAVQYAGKAPLGGGQAYELAFLGRQPWHRPHTRLRPDDSQLSRRYPPPVYPRWDNSQR